MSVRGTAISAASNKTANLFEEELDCAPEKANTMKFRERFRRFGKNQSGSVATEFAIVGTLFCVLIFVMIQMGMVFYSYGVMQNGARDGARRLAVDDDMYPSAMGTPVDCDSPAGVYDAATNPTVEAYTCSTMLLFADAQVAACITEDILNIRYDAEVVVTTLMSDVGMFDLFGVANGVTMTATAVARVENGKNVDGPPAHCGTNSISPIPS